MPKIAQTACTHCGKELGEGGRKSMPYGERFCKLKIKTETSPNERDCIRDYKQAQTKNLKEWLKNPEFRKTNSLLKILAESLKAHSIFGHYE